MEDKNIIMILVIVIVILAAVIGIAILFLVGVQWWKFVICAVLFFSALLSLKLLSIDFGMTNFVFLFIILFISSIDKWS